MELKQGTIRSLHQMSHTGFITGEGKSDVIFDQHDLRSVSFLDLRSEMAVQYVDVAVDGENFRDAILVVPDLDEVPKDSGKKKQGIVVCFNEVNEVGVLIDVQDRIPAFFAKSSILPGSFVHDIPRAEAEISYEFKLVNGRRIATSVSKSIPKAEGPGLQNSDGAQAQTRDEAANSTGGAHEGLVIEKVNVPNNPHGAIKPEEIDLGDEIYFRASDVKPPTQFVDLVVNRSKVRFRLKPPDNIMACDVQLIRENE